MAYAARSEKLDVPPALVEMVRPFDGESGYRAVLEVHRTRGSFCVSLFVAEAIADLNHMHVRTMPIC
jgi:hypothetical protein